MLMRDSKSNNLIKMDGVEDLMNPFKTKISGRSQSGEEEQDKATYTKEGLVFPSGEPLPRCWTDPEYTVD
jgi:hypothetical protein